MNEEELKKAFADLLKQIEQKIQKDVPELVQKAVADLPKPPVTPPDAKPATPPAPVAETVTKAVADELQAKLAAAEKRVAELEKVSKAGDPTAPKSDSTPDYVKESDAQLAYCRTK